MAGNARWRIFSTTAGLQRKVVCTPKLCHDATSHCCQHGKIEMFQSAKSLRHNAPGVSTPQVILQSSSLSLLLMVSSL